MYVNLEDFFYLDYFFPLNLMLAAASRSIRGQFFVYKING